MKLIFLSEIHFFNEIHFFKFETRFLKFETRFLKGIGGYFEITLPLQPPIKSP